MLPCQPLSTKLERRALASASGHVTLQAFVGCVLAVMQGPGNKLCRWTNQRATLLGKRELQKGSLPGSLMPDHSDDRSSK